MHEGMLDFVHGTADFANCILYDCNVGKTKNGNAGPHMEPSTKRIFYKLVKGRHT